MIKRIALPLVCLGAILLIASGALAHVTTETEDGRYIIVTGQQGEPVYTFQTTNLDLSFYENDEGDRGEEVADVHSTVNATLIGPGGEELTHALTPQFGQTGRYEFEEGYVLTRPGIYMLRLEGMVGETDVTGTYEMPGPIEDQSDVMFPDQSLPSLRDVSALQDRVDTLENQVARLEGQDGGSQENGEAPGPGAFALVALFAISAVVLRRKRQ